MIYSGDMLGICDMFQGLPGDLISSDRGSERMAIPTNSTKPISAFLNNPVVHHTNTAELRRRSVWLHFKALLSPVGGVHEEKGGSTFSSKSIPRVGTSHVAVGQIVGPWPRTRPLPADSGGATGLAKNRKHRRRGLLTLLRCGRCSIGG